MPLKAEDLPPQVTAAFRPPRELIERDDVALPQLYDWNAKENPDYPLFSYHDGQELRYVTYSSVNRAIDHAGLLVLSWLSSTDFQEGHQPVVALFADAESISYVSTSIGIMRAGCIVFFISTRNGSAAVADMLQRTHATLMLISLDAATKETAQTAVDALPAGSVNVRMVPSFEDLFGDSKENKNEVGQEECRLRRSYDITDIAMIQHSSGSTGHPKPIYWTHRRLFHLGLEPLQCDIDISRSIIGCHGTPMYHGLGSDMFAAAPMCGLVLATFRPASPPIVPSPDAVWDGIVATKADYTWGVPFFVEQWARDPQKVATMKHMRGLVFGGAALKKDVGDALAAQGVSLFNIYGSTEVGLMTLLVREHPGLDWEYFRLSPRHTCVFVPQGDGKYEIVVPTRPENPLPVTNTKIDGRDAYATSDLVEQHPTDKTLWRVYGRTDEQLTNPLPLERIINDDPHVKCSMIFGQGRFQNGVLVEPVEEHAIDSRDAKQLEKLRNMIWPSVERANEFGPQHSRIFKEMILLATPTKPFQYNVKGLLRRKFILADYKEEIEALYSDVDNSAHSDIEPPGTWESEEVLTFVRDVVTSTLGRTIPNDADIFRSGGDSLHATRIRNVITRALRAGHAAAAQRLPSNIVFDAPTIASLAGAVLSIVNDPEACVSRAMRSPQQLWNYVERYSAHIPSRPTDLVSGTEPGRDVVLITGTTGGFGCDALEHLLRDEKVDRVYAFNRKASNALERQRHQFRVRGLDEKLLDSPKFRMVEAELHETDFAIDPELLEEVRRSVTHILHNAWKVDFNLSLPSFDIDIRGARNLVDLALGSPRAEPPRFIFVSSIGVFANYSDPPPIPESPLDDPACPFGEGYAESKWVTERMLLNIGEKTGLHTVVVRLGQVAGDRLGHWNEKEWFPALVKSARLVHCLPDVEGSITWIPSYEGAKAFVEMRHAREPFVHLVHPHPAPWHTIVTPIAEKLGVPLVSYAAWLAALEESVSKDDANEADLMQDNPALRLLSFYKKLKISPEREPLAMVYLSTENAVRASETLAHLPELDASRAESWFSAWKRSGFL
ncbi:acetyl-CoA synthetase-like protein [Trametes cingulata]|nr:acetyl-CoA synthetase-like protein [Trametes cingulata]